MRDLWGGASLDESGPASEQVVPGRGAALSRGRRGPSSSGLRCGPCRRYNRWVSISPCRDVSAADWVVRSDLPWARLVSFGPAGFEAYARLRFLPDPVRRGQREADAHPDWRPPDQAATLLTVLSGHTDTPDDCLVGLWDGLGGPWPTPEVPSFEVPHRSYWLV